MNSDGIDEPMYRRFGKRTFDLIAATTALLLLSPVIAITALLVRWKLGSPVLFQQRRAGKSGEIFAVQKFRSMTDERDETGELLPDEVRLTATGRLLRKTSLDELPQLLNVIRGEMSLIGPRPLLTEYLPLYNEHQSRRHDVRPGITGWAQVNGRNTVPWPDRFDMDVHYVDHYGFALDTRILFLTLGKVFRGSDVNSEDSATMEKFTGNPLSDESSESGNVAATSSV